MWKMPYFQGKHEHAVRPEPVEGPFDRLRANGKDNDKEGVDV
jgi:hypothetical protein